MNSVYGKYFTKVALIWAGCLALFFFIYILTLAPLKGIREQLERRLEEKKRMYDSALKASQKETRIQLDEQIQQLRNKLKDLVIDFEDSANITFDISQIASGKAVTSFNIETKKDKKDSDKSKAKSDKYISESCIDISFSTTDFNQFAALLNALERHQPVIFVDRFTITRASRGSPEHQVKMNLAVFVRKTQDS
jgi:lipopolysaccharide export LptBFGC system permease protein LptF